MSLAQQQSGIRRAVQGAVVRNLRISEFQGIRLTSSIKRGSLARKGKIMVATEKQAAVRTEYGGMIVSTTEFLRRNNGHATLPETRPYKFNYRSATITQETGHKSKINTDSVSTQDTLRRVSSFGLAGDARAAAELAEETASKLRESGGTHVGAACDLERAGLFWLGVSGGAGKAVRDLENLLKARRHDGPGTALSQHEVFEVRSDIAYWRGESGDAGRALALFERLLVDVVSALGRNDFYALSTRNNVAYWRGFNGDLKRALDEYRDLVTDCVRILGSGNRDTLMIRNNLAYWSGQSGDAGGALALFERLLVDVVSALGRNDFYALSTRNNVAYWRGFNGDIPGALDQYRVLLGDCENILGERDYHTLSTRLQLGMWSGIAGELDYAIESLSGLLPDVEDELGTAHELGYSVRHQLARWYGTRGDTDKAVSILEQLVPDQQRVLGDNDYRTLASQGLLSRFRGF